MEVDVGGSDSAGSQMDENFYNVEVGAERGVEAGSDSDENSESSSDDSEVSSDESCGEVGGDGIDLNRDCFDLNEDATETCISAGGVADSVYVTPTRNAGSDKLVPDPEVGMVFPSWVELNKYYSSYGKQQGFGVVCVGGSQGKKGEGKNTYVWKCECYGRTTYRRMVNGKRITVTDQPILKKKSKKCSCPIMIYAKVNKEGGWEIKKAENKHQFHKPTPEKSKQFPMYKKENITKHIEYRIDNDHGSGAPVSQIYNNLANQRHGVENMGFTKKDMHNLVNRKRRLKLKNGDASAMLEYFSRMSEEIKIFSICTA